MADDVIEVHRPTPDMDDTSTTVLLANRPATLDGKTIGLLWNSKVNADIYLNSISESFAKRFTDVRFVSLAKPTASRPMDESILEFLRSCDAVVTGIGD